MGFCRDFLPYTIYNKLLHKSISHHSTNSVCDTDPFWSASRRPTAMSRPTAEKCTPIYHNDGNLVDKNEKKNLPVANMRPGTNSPRPHRARYFKSSQSTRIFLVALRSHGTIFFLIWISIACAVIWVRLVTRMSSTSRISAQNEALRSFCHIET